MRSTVKILAALASLAVLAGCGGGGGGSSSPVNNPVPPVNQPSPTPSPTPAGPSVSAPALSNFTATLSEDSGSIAVGGTVSYTLTITNTSNAAATVIDSVSGTTNVPQATLRVANSVGATVYPPPTHPLDAPPPPPTSGAVTLQPGDKISLTRALSVFATAGAYQAVATFTVAASPTDAPKIVTLSPLAVTAK